MSYETFIDRKTHLGGEHGFAPVFMPDVLIDFQRSLVGWAVRRGRAALFADCGLGKTPMQLVWAENIARKTGRRGLIAAPLAVSAQTVREGEKFGVEIARSRDGRPAGPITITNYERLHLFDPADFDFMVCDESSILKNFDGALRALITEFMRKMRYRLLCTATAAPNDYTELGTSSEALGGLGHADMLSRFFRPADGRGGADTGRSWGKQAAWRFKGHAPEPFWRWVCSWARAVRRPSDIGFADGRFVLPPIVENEHVVRAATKRGDMLFDIPARDLFEEREEARRTLRERCEKVAELVAHKRQAIVWCHLNDEGNLLERLIPDALQVAGADDDDAKEERLSAFATGEARVLITKPKIAGWGLNLQRCAHVVMFPSHSFEQYYQSVRRCWRYGQENRVVVDLVTSEGGRGVLDNLQRKAAAANVMFDRLVAHMNDAQTPEHRRSARTVEVPPWVS